MCDTVALLQFLLPRLYRTTPSACSLCAFGPPSTCPAPSNEASVCAHTQRGWNKALDSAPGRRGASGLFVCDALGESSAATCARMPGSSSSPLPPSSGGTPTADSRMPTSARKGSNQYSDRFIPSRRGVNLQDSFALLPDSQPKKRDAPQEGGKDDNLDTYTMLLRSEFLGSEPPGGRRSDELSPASPQRNLFRFRMGMPNARADENAAYALSPVGSDSQRVLCSPRKAPRKISTVPYKVLDAPALQVSDCH